MGKFTRITTEIPDLFLLEPRVFPDSRGYFLESYNKRDLAEVGLKAEFVQDNLSRSSRGVLRGLHFQIRQPQGKLVQVIRGEVFDVAVDIRKGSPTFGQWEGVILSEENHRLFYLPEGFAHGFLVLSEEADFAYKCTNYYCPDGEGGLRWNDPQLAIQWPVKDIEPILSDKDRMASLFSEFKTPFNYTKQVGGGQS